MDENWVPVVGYEGFYEVSKHGAVRSLPRSRIIKWRDRDVCRTVPARAMSIGHTQLGYQYVNLRLPDQKGVKALVHRLVMRAFVGVPPEGRFQVNHINGIKSDNQLENLEYCSSQENLLHLTRVLKRKIGGAGASAKLSPDQVLSIFSDPRQLKAIAADYAVSFQAIWLIKKGRNWGHLTSPAPIPNSCDGQVSR